ncbi:MAG: transcription termination factor Rho [Synergistaceae bacterium]|nr:transcription termination factor Rho [Synergistaceae bacterium]
MVASKEKKEVAEQTVLTRKRTRTVRETTAETPARRRVTAKTPSPDVPQEPATAEAPPEESPKATPKPRGRRPRLTGGETPLLPLLAEPSAPEPSKAQETAPPASQETPEPPASQPVATESPSSNLPAPAAVPEPPAPAVEVYSPPKPKHSYGYLAAQTLVDLRKIGKELSVPGATTLRKDDLIISVLKAQAESMNYKFGGGTLEILPEGFGFLRPKGMLPTDNDVYLSVSQIRRFGLRNGDVIWGLIRPPREQEHYEALLRVETVNFSDPEHSRRRAQFGQLTPIFPNIRMNLETGPKDLATRLVDMFAPIGMGQRALIVSPPKAGKTTLLKRIANAISVNCPDVILMALLIDERPEEVTDIARSVDGEVIASTFDRPADEHIRVANLALEKAKRLAEAKRDVVILLDSITRLARASNLTVPPSGRTLSGGLDPSGLYFPKRFFGAARNFEEGGSLTIVGTALTDTGSRMDDVIYEEFKGTGNMELHLSRKLAEQRIFPAIDITRSGTRREELLMPEDELARLWVLRKRIVGVDEAGALNLILDKLRQTQNNKEFLLSIKLP